MPFDDYEDEDQESLSARSEQAIGELAQALLDSQVLENALAAAFGAREGAGGPLAAMSALNLPSARDVDGSSGVRSVSERIDDLEDQIDRVPAARSASCVAKSAPRAKPNPRL